MKKWLLAGRHNQYHPKILRPLGLVLVVVLLLGINLTQNLVASHSFRVLGVATDISASEIIALSNQQRANNGVPGLSTDAKLTAAAQAKAADMLAKDYWSHYSPDGATPWSFISGAGYAYVAAGENLAKGFDTSAGVVDGWMNSPAHRANVLNATFLDTGVAAVNGTLQGEDVTLVVAMYGARKITSSHAPASSRPSTPAKSSKPTPVATTTPVQTEPPVATPTENQPVPTTSKSNQQSPGGTSAAVPESELRALTNDRAVSVREQRTWGQNATLFVLTTLLLISIFKHTIVWRVQKRGWRHIWLRAHPAAQYGLLFVAIVANLASGVGVIR